MLLFPYVLEEQFLTSFVCKGICFHTKERSEGIREQQAEFKRTGEVQLGGNSYCTVAAMHEAGKMFLVPLKPSPDSNRLDSLGLKSLGWKILLLNVKFVNGKQQLSGT